MPGLEASNLGPYPILQLTAAIIILMGVGIAVWRGVRDKGKSKDDDDDVSASSRWFFDGPLKRHLEVQEEIAEHVNSVRHIAIRTEQEKIGEELRNQTKLLERIAGSLERRRS